MKRTTIRRDPVQPMSDSDLDHWRRCSKPGMILPVRVYPVDLAAFLSRLDAERARADANEALLLKWDQDIGAVVQDRMDAVLAECERLRGALNLIASMAGHHDAAEGCRNIIARVREALNEPKTCDFGVAHPFENDPVHGQDCACLDDNKLTFEESN